VRSFVQLVNRLDYRGYFEEAFGKDCVDMRSDVSPSFVIEERIGKPDVWPLNSMNLTSDINLFYDVVEVLHDLIARPRSGWEHDYSGCGWHYSEFSREAGRRLYRWHVNRLLGRGDSGLSLAADGEDVGRLVVSTDEARMELVRRMEERTDSARGQVRHAIALFRARDADAHQKRSAVNVLALVLEERRRLLKEVLYTGDEGTLFEIANRFAIRHQDQRQKSDYDPIFLDWVFWWYLATIELTDRVVSRDPGPPGD
jgi:hypothetical protein